MNDHTNGHTNGIGADHTNVEVGNTPVVELDVLIIGAGFTGCYLLPKLRNMGFNVKVVEAGAELGGVWYWNRYPGARVDSPYPIYSLSLPEIWNTWNWKEKYPGQPELREYFRFVDEKLDLSKDILYNSTVAAATFNEANNTWLVSCTNGKKIQTRFLVSGTGFAAKQYIPKWKGMDKFKGRIIHSSNWDEDFNVQGKKLAVVGQGASGIQIVQECAKDVEKLTLFVRNPNLCLPMRQRSLTAEEQVEDKKQFVEVYKRRLETIGGLTYGPLNQPLTAASVEEREKVFEGNWQEVQLRNRCKTLVSANN
jgi:cation diffusion facilitator CzcD-associated flavoprotein CzcO